MELCGPTRQRVIDIVGSVVLVRPCETISENVKQVNEAFEMPEIELCPTVRFKIRPIRLRWEALEQKKCKENIQLLPTHNYFFASLGIKLRTTKLRLPGIYALTATAKIQKLGESKEFKIFGR